MPRRQSVKRGSAMNEQRLPQALRNRDAMAQALHALLKDAKPIIEWFASAVDEDRANDRTWLVNFDAKNGALLLDTGRELASLMVDDFERREATYRLRRSFKLPGPRNG